MWDKLKDLIKDKMTFVAVAGCAVMLFISFLIIMIIQLNNDEEIAVLQAGFYEVPVIRNDSLQELGNLYSKLNESFEQEINQLTTSNVNRHNKSDNTINPITHYGLYGQENPSNFKNDYYKNGINITYEKSTASVVSGKSNFNDIIAVMAVLYDQQMDTEDNEELKKTFENLFWISHTYTYYSSELYPCMYGCSAINRYKCSDVFNDYKNTNLKYNPFLVSPHDLYEEKGYSDEDFEKVYPTGTCEVCGVKGSGCEKDEAKICYHGSGNILLDDYDNKVIEDYLYAELGEVYKEEGIDDNDINEDESGGKKISKNNMGCRYYRDVKYCKFREDSAKRIESLHRSIESKEKELERLMESDDFDENRVESINNELNDYEMEINNIKVELTNHINNECESTEINKKYWCDGFKVCLGHKTHYKCPSHKLVVCYGHTDINVSIKIMYADEILNELYKMSELK